MTRPSPLATQQGTLVGYDSFGHYLDAENLRTQGATMLVGSLAWSGTNNGFLTDGAGYVRALSNGRSATVNMGQLDVTMEALIVLGSAGDTAAHPRMRVRALSNYSGDGSSDPNRKAFEFQFTGTSTDHNGAIGYWGDNPTTQYTQYDLSAIVGRNVVNGDAVRVRVAARGDWIHVWLEVDGEWFTLDPYEIPDAHKTIHGIGSTTATWVGIGSETYTIAGTGHTEVSFWEGFVSPRPAPLDTAQPTDPNGIAGDDLYFWFDLSNPDSYTTTTSFGAYGDYLVNIDNLSTASERGPGIKQSQTHEHGPIISTATQNGLKYGTGIRPGHNTFARFNTVNEIDLRSPLDQVNFKEQMIFLALCPYIDAVYPSVARVMGYSLSMLHASGSNKSAMTGHSSGRQLWDVGDSSQRLQVDAGESSWATDSWRRESWVRIADTEQSYSNSLGDTDSASFNPTNAVSSFSQVWGLAMEPAIGEIIVVRGYDADVKATLETYLDRKWGLL